MSKSAISVDEDGNSLSEKEIIAQAVLLIFAGHETTTAMFTWLVTELARHPEVLQRAREEQLQLAQSGSLTNEDCCDSSFTQL